MKHLLLIFLSLFCGSHLSEAMDSNGSLSAITHHLDLWRAQASVRRGLNPRELCCLEAISEVHNFFPVELSDEESLVRLGRVFASVNSSEVKPKYQGMHIGLSAQSFCMLSKQKQEACLSYEGEACKRDIVLSQALSKAPLWYILLTGQSPLFNAVFESSPHVQKFLSSDIRKPLIWFLSTVNLELFRQNWFVYKDMKGREDDLKSKLALTSNDSILLKRRRRIYLGLSLLGSVAPHVCSLSAMYAARHIGNTSELETLLLGSGIHYLANHYVQKRLRDVAAEPMKLEGFLPEINNTENRQC